MRVLRTLPEYRDLERQEAGRTSIEQYRYWRALASQQIAADPAGQIRLVVRKAMRFWMYLPVHSWIPAWKTGLVAAIAIPLLFVGIAAGRREPVVQICALGLLGLWAIHSLVHSELRYAFPVLPLAFVLVLRGAAFLVDRFGLTLPANLHVWPREPFAPGGRT
jgi:hypothetical protein